VFPSWGYPTIVLPHYTPSFLIDSDGDAERVLDRGIPLFHIRYEKKYFVKMKFIATEMEGAGLEESLHPNGRYVETWAVEWINCPFEL